MVTGVPLRRDVKGERLTPQPRSTMRRRAVAVAVFVSAALLAVVPSAGAGVLDQSQPVIRANVATSVSDSNNHAQLFTNGLTGALDQVDIAVGRTASFITASLLVEIRPVSGGVLSGPAPREREPAGSERPGRRLPLGVLLPFRLSAGVGDGRCSVRDRGFVRQLRIRQLLPAGPRPGWRFVSGGPCCQRQRRRDMVPPLDFRLLGLGVPDLRAPGPDEQAAVQEGRLETVQDHPSRTRASA